MKKERKDFICESNNSHATHYRSVKVSILFQKKDYWQQRMLRISCYMDDKTRYSREVAQAPPAGGESQTQGFMIPQTHFPQAEEYSEGDSNDTWKIHSVWTEKWFTCCAKNLLYLYTVIKIFPSPKYKWVNMLFLKRKNWCLWWG